MRPPKDSTESFRFIIFSDLHLHLWTYGSKLVAGRNQRLLDQINVLHQMFEYAEERGINNVFFCGDFFHTHGNLKTEVLDAACD
ncbi:MAG: hypothetical protein ACXAB9_15715, partial [Candidatus Thorarchaeota archaeon]